MSELKKTSLHDIHLKLGAKMAEFAGFDMPLQYSSVKEEVLAVRNSCGLFDVSHMGEFFIEGNDAVKFVDYILTNDFLGAELEKAVYSPLCDKNGYIVDDLIAYKLSENKVLLCVNAANIEKDWQFIEGLTQGFDCHLKNTSDDFSLLALQGPNSQELLEKAGLLPNDNSFEYYSAKSLSLKDGDFIIARTGYTGEDGFEVFASHQNIQKAFSKLIELGATPCGLASRDVLRLEVCYPLYGHELNQELTPLDSGLKWTVRNSKPSFYAKEALENYKPKMRLVKLSLDKAIPRQDYEILNEKEEVIGKVTSGTMSVVLEKGICLGLVQKDQFPANKEFSIRVRNRIFKANYHTKPFVSGGHK